MGLRILYSLVATILLAMFQLFAAASGETAVVLLVAIIIAGLTHGLWSFIELDSMPTLDKILPGCVASLGVLCGLLLNLIFGFSKPNTMSWLALPSVLIVSGA